MVAALAQCKTVTYNLSVDRVPASPDRYPVIAIRVSGDNYDWEEDRPFPGPTIRAKLGDTLEVTLHNKFETETTSLHFHGLHMKNNPWMDGVADVTQCPIAPMTTFTYTFNVTETGTFWYHAHSGHQYSAGFLGAVVIDYPTPEEDPVRQQFPYTYDQTIILQEWFHEDENSLHYNYRGPYNAFSRRRNWQGSENIFQPNYPWKAHSLLMNGRGDYNCAAINETKKCFNRNPCGSGEQCIRERQPLLRDCRTESYPLDEFKCGGKYARFRLINGAGNVPFKLWIDNHDLIIVARDGIETKPLTVQYIIIPVGQRIDFMVVCNKYQFPLKKYMIYATIAVGYLPEGADNPPILDFVAAHLTYPPGVGEVHTPAFLPAEDPTRTEGSDETFEYKLEPLVETMSPPADERIILLGGEVYSMLPGEPLEEWTINGITHTMPKFAILPHLYLAHASTINECLSNHGVGPMGNERRTNILHLEYGKTYEFILLGVSGQQHPWHLHGYYMDFIAAGRLNRSTDFESLGVDECGFDRPGSVKQSVIDSFPDYKEPAKVLSRGDIFTVPRYGYSIFRVKMDNQGPWLFHCHVGWHLGMGMAMIFSVEKNGSYPGIVEPTVDFPAYMSMALGRRGRDGSFPPINGTSEPLGSAAISSLRGSPILSAFFISSLVSILFAVQQYVK
ncbi:putative L-ascorbate oxidase [Hypsibius exemplaris]|uniref:L-ascorbate oxidase n=1 Tax=Hypsibius exemplaris TaxID=2072580 RepID=A0A9X6NHT1_HYPEX|nr:putative L-ascorbate oxidase [Hypsibius exemplaris]